MLTPQIQCMHSCFAFSILKEGMKTILTDYFSLEDFGLSLYAKKKNTRLMITEKQEIFLLVSEQ